MTIVMAMTVTVTVFAQVVIDIVFDPMAMAVTALWAHEAVLTRAPGPIALEQVRHYSTLLNARERG